MTQWCQLSTQIDSTFEHIISSTFSMHSMRSWDYSLRTIRPEMLFLFRLCGILFNLYDERLDDSTEWRSNNWNFQLYYQNICSHFEAWRNKRISGIIRIIQISEWIKYPNISNTWASNQLLRINRHFRSNVVANGRVRILVAIWMNQKYLNWDNNNEWLMIQWNLIIMMQLWLKNLFHKASEDFSWLGSKKQ